MEEKKKTSLGKAKVLASLRHGRVHLCPQLLIGLVLGKIQFCFHMLVLLLVPITQGKTYG